LILEQLARNRVFLGDEGLQKVQDAYVVVVGCGGVGSWAATMLVRSGVGKIKLVDFDQVTLSSLNRHAVATLADVGTPKVMALRKHLEQVAPWVEIDATNELWNKENGERLLAGNPTYVVDAIDNIETKVDLLHFCHSRGIPVISSMGAGCKSDPTRVCFPVTRLLR
jgi:tRNA A37 threonylcarbamoyladenosine dehydratase